MGYGLPPGREAVSKSVLSYRLTKVVSFSPDERILKRKYCHFTYPGQSTRVNLPP